MKKTSEIPTLRKVAEKAGVSVPTASSILNGHAKKLRIAKATCDRVNSIAEQLGYQANPFASSLRLKRSYSIGVIWSFNGPHGANGLVRSFSERAMKLGYNALVYDSVGLISVMESQIKELMRRRVDGIVIQLSGGSLQASRSNFISLLSNQANVLAVTDVRWRIPFPQIIHSRTKALEQAVGHLLATGRRQFAFVGLLRSQAVKVSAIKKGLEAAGRKDVEFVALDFPDPYTVTRERLSKILWQHAGNLDAILTATDEIAAAVIGCLRADGKKVPHDVAVVGFNNIPMASLFDIPIASVERFDDQLAIQAIEQVITAVEKAEVLPEPVKTLDMEFVWRESAGGVALKVPK